LTDESEEQFLPGFVLSLWVAHLLGACLNVLASTFAAHEHAGALNDKVNSLRSLWKPYNSKGCTLQ
jgi:hypothetical protein